VVTLTLLTELDTLFDNIASELVLRVCQELGHDNDDHAVAILLVTILNDMLDDIVTELIRDEVGCACMEFTKNRFTINFFAVLEHSLDNPATIRVSCKSVHLATERIDDELDIVRGHSLNRLLNNVVTVLVSNALQHMILQLFDHSGLLVSENVLEGLLNNATTIHLGR